MDPAKEGGRHSTVSKTPATGDLPSQIIVMLTSAIAALLPSAGGVNGAVVAFAFGDDLVYIYYAFLVCVMFAFSSSFSSIFLLQAKPKASRLFKISGIMCFSSAIILVFSAIFYNYYFFN